LCAQYGAEPFEQQQFGTAGDEGVNGIAGTTKGCSPYYNEYQVQGVKS